MKNLLLFALFSILGLTKAQNHRFIYEVDYKKDSTQSTITKVNYHLDIYNGTATYYTRDFFVADSLINNNLPFPKDMKLSTSHIITHKIGSNIFNEYDPIEGDIILNLPGITTQNWDLTSEKKKLDNLNLQKATTTWGGRNWTAWFSPDIAVQEGPYKFYGLPGLIVDLQDDKGSYHFHLVKSQNLTSEPKNQYLDSMKQMAAVVNKDKYKKAKLAFYDAPISYLGGLNGAGQLFLNDGTKVNASNQREYNEKIRKEIKSNNNPINLTEAIVYP